MRPSNRSLYVLLIAFVVLFYGIVLIVENASLPSICFISLLILPPLSSNVDLYLIDTNAADILQNDCRAKLALPLSVMISEKHAQLSLDENLYNVAYFSDNGEYWQLHSEPARVLLKQDFHRQGPLLVPVDLRRFNQLFERSRLIPCLNISIDRSNATVYSAAPSSLMPIDFQDKMAKLRDHLINLDLMPFITGGSLLGWYRECGIIPHTYDADFGILSHEYRSSMLEKMKNLEGFSLVKSIGRNFDSLEFTFYATRRMIDLFLFYDEDDDHIYTHGLDKGGARFKWIYPRPPGYCSGILRNRLFFVPCNVEEDLKATYGDNWKLDHPTKSFIWHSSAKNGRRFGSFTKEEMKKYYNYYW